MGEYTEIIVKARLKADMPDIALQALRYMANMRDDVPSELPDHPLFSADGWYGRSGMLRGWSSYFPDREGPELLHAVAWKDGQRAYLLTTRSSFKNYDGQACLFASWLQPYCLPQFEGETDAIMVMRTEDMASRIDENFGSRMWGHDEPNPNWKDWLVLIDQNGELGLDWRK